jgi:transposase InsO family protein
MIRELIHEAVTAGARREKACEVLGLTARTLERWDDDGEDARRGPKSPPPNKLSAVERRRVVEVATSPEFRDLSPKQIVPQLADRKQYVASESTFYRVLRAENMQHRRGAARTPSSRPREHIATGPWQVGSWDITYLKSLVRGQFFFLYLVVDVWSRKILGWDVHDVESADLAAALVQRIREEAGPGVDLRGWVLHADNGGPMKGATMLATMQRLGVVPSFSRPSVSNDNPFSESLFRTMKYVPEYPRDGFATLEAARTWVTTFVDWYNHRHRHSSIGFVAPDDRHAGRDVDILAARRKTYERARRRNPERWARQIRPWKRPAVVRLNPIEGHAVVDGEPTGPRDSSPAGARPASRPRSAEPSLGEGSLGAPGRAKATRDSRGGTDRHTA